MSRYRRHFLHNYDSNVKLREALFAILGSMASIELLVQLKKKMFHFLYATIHFATDPFQRRKMLEFDSFIPLL